MPQAGYKLTSVSATRDADGAYIGATWTATFTDADGAEHWTEVPYSFTTSSEWTPTAAALLASAKTEADVLAAVTADADRALADLVDPNTPAGRIVATPIALEN